MSSIKNKVAAVLLVAFVATLVPVQTASAADDLVLCNVNDISNWEYLPGIPTPDDGYPTGSFMNTVTNETQKSDWIYKVNTNEDGIPDGTGYWTKPATSEIDTPPMVSGSAGFPPDYTQDYFTFRSIGGCEQGIYQAIYQNRDTGAYYMGGKEASNIINWTTAEVNKCVANTKYSKDVVYNQGIAAQSGVGIFGIDFNDPIVKIAITVASIAMAAYGVGFNIAISEGQAAFMNTYTPFTAEFSASSYEIATGVSENLSQVSNLINADAATYSGYYITVAPLPALLALGVGTGGNWTVKVGTEASTCTNPIPVEPVVTPPAGVCGSANGVATVDAPGANLCSTGTAKSDPALYCPYQDSNGFCEYAAGGANWQWNCDSTACSAPATAPVSPPITCPATTISNCGLPLTVSGGSAGSCSIGYTGTCNYTCDNGTWSQNSNSCTPTVVTPTVPEGALKLSPTSCVIPIGASTCSTVYATWTTKNATDPKLVDINPNGNGVLTYSNVKNQAAPGLQVWVAYPQTVFELRDGSTKLDTKTAMADCVTGSVWGTNSGKCVVTTVTTGTACTTGGPPCCAP